MPELPDVEVYIEALEQRIVDWLKGLSGADVVLLQQLPEKPFARVR